MNNGAIGRVVGVHGFRVTVELDGERRSPVQSDLDGVRTVVAINSFLTFSLGAGVEALGIITDLDARETFDKNVDDLTLELTKPRRIVTTQLLGTLTSTGADLSFGPGISILPTLDTPALPAKEAALAAIFRTAPQRNKPPESTNGQFDSGLRLGWPIGLEHQSVFGSFNDLFSRPLAVVGNTGSGKSCSVAHLIQESNRSHSTNRPHFFVLDINGEFASSFGIADPTGGKRPNCLYVNGKEFGIPVWLMTSWEVSQWLSAAEQIQEPTLKNLWSAAKGKGRSGEATSAIRAVQDALARVDNLESTVAGSGPYKGENAIGHLEAIKSFVDLIEDAPDVGPPLEGLEELVRRHSGAHASFGGDEAGIVQEILHLKEALQGLLHDVELEIEESADKPTYFPISAIRDPAALFDAARSEAGNAAFRQNLTGLKLRLANRIEDKRWAPFFNYEALKLNSLKKWIDGLTRRKGEPKSVCVIDCSMLADEVLPYATGIVGRTLLELREHANANGRFREPWTIVLEEAHNYVRPARSDEPRGLRISRSAFERVAKEGRKFGFSMIVASQRPSEISGTVLSQCANFIMHRLQNPDDIDHFRRIVPSQSRRLLDQVSILRAGEALVLGSAFQVPSRVQMELPNPMPSSRTAAPFLEWRKDSPAPFDRDEAMRNWGVLD